MTFQVDLAGSVFGIEAMCPGTVHFFKGFLAEGKSPDIMIRPTRADMKTEWAYELQSLNGANMDTKNFGTWTSVLERRAIYHLIGEQLPAQNVLLMHGAVVSDGLSACMFTAASGTGKTTRAKLALENHPDFFILNGDKPLIRVEEERVVACGSPWNGKENYGVNAEAPLAAIFLLERADHTALKELTVQEAFSFLLRQTFIPSDPAGAMKAMQLLHAMSGKVRVFRFLSEPTAESVETALRAAGLA